MEAALILIPFSCFLVIESARRRKQYLARIADLEMQLKVLRNEGWITDFDSPEAKALAGGYTEFCCKSETCNFVVSTSDWDGKGNHIESNGWFYRILAVRPSTAYQGE